MRKNIICFLLLAAVCMSFCACGADSGETGIVPTQNASVKSVEKMIKKIGAVTADSTEAVEAAEAAYNSLSEEDKAEVDNSQMLFEARAMLDTAVRIRKVEHLIESVCNEQTGDLSRIGEVKALFDALPAEEQVQVANIAVLQTALEEKDYSEQQELQQQILGWWDCSFVEKDIIHIESIVAGYVGESTRNFSDYLPSSDFTMHTKMVFNKDGTYTLTRDEEKIAEEIDQIIAAADLYYAHTLRVSIARNLQISYGIAIDPFYDYAWDWGFGMTFEAMAEQNLKRPLEEILQGLNDQVRPVIEEAVRGVELSSGNYRLGEGKLYLAKDGVSESAYVVCERMDDAVVFTESVQEQVFTPERIPVTLTKENG
ncbi:MAG: hypothetical protein IKT07_09230 [Oscillospiraceae bacterium]|nr:hypothetical protein [Oscillospiraceae bacterium]